MGVPNPDDPDQPPGARNLVRILTESLQAHNDALSEGNDLAAALTPALWFGTARDSFVDTGLPKIDTEWRKVADVNRLATDLIAGHSTFVHNLPDLWTHYGNDPAERARLWALWRQRSAEVAEELLAMAARLDELGHVDFADPATIAGPADLPEPTPHQILDPAPPPQLPPGEQQAAALFTRSYRTAERLRVQMLMGERRDHIPWAGWQAMGGIR